jgi:S1-C subfamily serine protease
VDINSTFNYQSASGAGTGIVLTANGEVITNNHVINGATSISVTDLGNGKTYSATVVGYDDTDDIAVLQLENASGLTTAAIGDSSSATVGEPVVAIGNAGGVGGTPTSAGGSITALRRSITAGDELDGTSEQLSGLIQVNADVQSGDSGGSLVNAKGQVVGMDTAASAGFSFQTSGTQGYAIPISQALSTARGIESGTAGPDVHVGATAFLGLKINAATGGSASSGGFPGSAAGNSGSSGTPAAAGATVNSVVAGGAAQSAGIGANDVITSLDGKAISSPSALSKALVPYHPGNKVTIGWTDPSGSPHTATVALGSGPPA